LQISTTVLGHLLLVSRELSFVVTCSSYDMNFAHCSPYRCCEAMHVGCARWAASLTYAKINDKNLKMCYYFPGMPPTYSGEGYTDTVSKCFCRVHAREIQDGQAKESSGTAPSLTNDRKRKSSNEDCSKSDTSNEHYNSEDSEKERRLQADIARKKKKRRIMEESDEEESD